MTFYAGLRNDVVASLIAQFGQAATYRIYEAATYSNVTGETTRGGATDTTINLVELPVRDVGSTAAQEFSEAVTAQMSALLLVSAKELDEEGITPAVEQTIIYDRRTTRILAIKRIAPGGVAVAYKMAVQHA